MELAIHLPSFNVPGGPAGIASALAGAAKTAEELGCTQFTLMDHYFQMEGFAPATDPMLEGYSSLGFLAGQTESITLGLLVTGVTYRHPGLLAKIVATLDVLSGGRAQLGIGAAWYEREHLGLGVRFPPVAERFERLEEALEICRQMWSDDDGPYEGRHYRLAETLCEPRPLQQPSPKILIGGSGEKKTLRLVAKHADACNLFASTPEEIARKLAVLDAHCAEVGRDPASIRRTMLWSEFDAAEDPEGFVAAVAPYAPLGIEKVFVMPAGTDPVGWVARVAEVAVPRLGEL